MQFFYWESTHICMLKFQPLFCTYFLGENIKKYFHYFINCMTNLNLSKLEHFETPIFLVVRYNFFSTVIEFCFLLWIKIILAPTLTLPFLFAILNNRNLFMLSMLGIGNASLHPHLKIAMPETKK